MSLGQAIKSCNDQYFGFSGRARRSEYWLFSLFGFLVPMGIVVVGLILGAATQDPFLALGLIELLNGLFALYMIIPGLAVACRRLHDTGKSGAYILIDLIPVIGPILVLIWMLQDSDPGENQYGPNPKTLAPVVASKPASALPQNVRSAVPEAALALSEAPTSYDNQPTAYQRRNEDSMPTVSIHQGELRILTGQMRGAVIPLPEGDRIWLGRDPNKCGVVLDAGYEKVSRAHCCVSYDSARGRYAVMDQSSNGTMYANMQRLTRGVTTYVAAGTELLLGDRQCRIRLE